MSSLSFLSHLFYLSFLVLNVLFGAIAGFAMAPYYNKLLLYRTSNKLINMSNYDSASTCTRQGINYAENTDNFNLVVFTAKSEWSWVERLHHSKIGVEES